MAGVSEFVRAGVDGGKLDVEHLDEGLMGCFLLPLGFGSSIWVRLRSSWEMPSCSQ